MVNALEKLKREPRRIYALQDKNLSSLSLSASGGAFALIAREILKQGGVIFGSAMEENGYVHHIKVSSILDLPKIQGSNYTKSSLEGTLKECFEIVSQGQLVLFSGTPCQIDALAHYFIKKGQNICKDNLLTCDLVCHGVTDPYLFRSYIKWLEEQNKALPGTLRFRFRAKDRGWGLNFKYTFRNKSGKTKEVFGPAWNDRYYNAYLEGFLFEARCYSCAFASKGRLGDFTLGDYWGIEKEHPEFQSERGASLVFLNSERAEKFFDSYMKNQCVYLDSTFEKASKENSNLKSPTCLPKEYSSLRQKIDSCMKDANYYFIFNELLREKGIKATIKRILPQRILNFIVFNNKV